ncbi:Hypothetical predicted protein [Cloeon dipterum]|uniref:Uncharacterized protein n=1 Tax=Cloeon dipterum TaxID=197152 RepID=A0A8S1DIQ8_9INSE|nr:Hypothetical predicted protein [Cloeon dipterum]
MDGHDGLLHYQMSQLAASAGFNPQPHLEQAVADESYGARGRGSGRGRGGGPSRGAARHRRTRTCRQRADLLDGLLEILAGRMAHPDAHPASAEGDQQDNLTRQLAAVNANLTETNTVIRIGAQEMFHLRHRVTSLVLPTLQSIAQEIGKNTSVIADMCALLREEGWVGAWVRGCSRALREQLNKSRERRTLRPFDCDPRLQLDRAFQSAGKLFALQYYVKCLKFSTFAGIWFARLLISWLTDRSEDRGPGGASQIKGC